MHVISLTGTLLPALLASAIAAGTPIAPESPTADVDTAVQPPVQLVSAAPPSLGRVQVLETVPALFADPAAAGSALGAAAAPAGTLVELATPRPQVGVTAGGGD